MQVSLVQYGHRLQCYNVLEPRHRPVRLVMNLQAVIDVYRVRIPCDRDTALQVFFEAIERGGSQWPPTATGLFRARHLWAISAAQMRALPSPILGRYSFPAPRALAARSSLRFRPSRRPTWMWWLSGRSRL